MRTLTLALALLLAACGTKDLAGDPNGAGGAGGSVAPYDPASCEADLAAFTACGGDPTGSWSAVAACIQGDPAAGLRENIGKYPSCADAPFELAIDPLGAMRFDTDGTYESSMVLDLRVTMTLSDACLRELSQGAPVGPSLICAQVDGRPAGGSTLECSYGAGGCTCSVDQSRPSAGGGTYEVRGTDLVLSGGAGTGFCVRGDLLFLQLPGDSTGAIDSGLLVLRRQG